MHGWLEDRAADDQVLISIHDDATSRLMAARFVERDDGAENRRTMIAYLRRHGRPLAVYTDHAGHFGQWLTKKEERTDTIILRALGELGVKVILAGSPQAKGRVERTFGTAQDRLIKEMPVAGIDTLDGANRFLAEWWTPFWNERFTVVPRDPVDAHRPLPSGIDLEALFAETETRKVAATSRSASRSGTGRSRSGKPGTCAPSPRSSSSAGWTANSTSGSETDTWPSSRWVAIRLAPTLRGPSSRNRRSRARSRRNQDRTTPGASTSAPAPGRPWPERE